MRHIVKSVLIAVCTVGLATGLQAADWPSEKPIRVLVGFGVGKTEGGHP